MSPTRLIEWFDANPQKHRRGEAECFDKDYPTGEDTIGYTYMHWYFQDALLGKGQVVGDVFADTMAEFARLFDSLGIKMGDVVMRMIKYDELKSGKAHFDIDLITKTICSIDDMGKLHWTNATHFGTFAERILGLNIKPDKHKFNPRKHRYSLLVFGVPHFSVDCKDGKSVGEVLTENCYSQIKS